MHTGESSLVMSETLSGYSDFHFVTEAIPEFWNFSSLCALQRCLKARIWLLSSVILTKFQKPKFGVSKVYHLE